jgi:hypothetical protein
MRVLRMKDKMRIPLEERRLAKRTSPYGHRVTELPDIFSDELLMTDYVGVSHINKKGEKFSMKMQVSELMAFIQRNIHAKYD